MARILALDWDRCEARYVLATTRGAAVQLEAIGSVPLLEETPAGTAQQADVGSSLATELARYDCRHAVGIVALNRGSFELVQLTLPPCSDAELPELVRNQSLQESATVADDAVIDFAALNDDPAEPRPVAAIAADPAQVAQATAVCAAAGAAAKRAIVRPYATAMLLLPALDDPAAPTLALNVFPEELDVILLAERRAVYWRTVRLPGLNDSEETVRRLAAEIQRTVAVAQQENLLPSSPTSAWLLGSADEQQTLAGALGDQLGVPIQLADPLALAGAKADSPPENVGRYAALVAAVWAESRRAAPPIDLLHPKQPARRGVRWQGPAVLAGLLAVVLGYFVVTSWRELADVQGENDRLAARKRQLDESVRKAGEQQQLVAAVRQWQSGEVCWLDELWDFSQRFPAGTEAQVLRLTLARGREGRGDIYLEGAVRVPEAVTELAQALAGPFHEFHADSVQQREGQADYGWHFQAQVSVVPRKKHDYLPPPVQP